MGLCYFLFDQNYSDNMHEQSERIGIMKLQRQFFSFNKESIIGTRGFIPPEYLIEFKYYSRKGDIFSLGIILLLIFFDYHKIDQLYNKFIKLNSSLDFYFIYFLLWGYDKFMEYLRINGIEF